MKTPFSDFVAWAITNGTPMAPDAMFALMGDATLTPRERAILATMAGIMYSAAPEMLAALLREFKATHGNPVLQDVLAIQAFVITVEAHAAEAIATGEAADDRDGAHHRAIEFVFEAIKEGTLALADVKGQPS